jgi:uncharacterized OB-fold protein
MNNAKKKTDQAEKSKFHKKNEDSKNSVSGGQCNTCGRVGHMLEECLRP